MSTSARKNIRPSVSMCRSIRRHSRRRRRRSRKM